ncbi:MAG: pyridoxal phosphate-dependent aminotransferase [Defluviitaleaceae bacterium]|nr:pyridoxal phosphate-dependent aminotransferase [Defluviitaleaceae bacterium]
MDYGFDKVVERRGTDSLKFDGAVKRGMPADVLPLWVADMDFPAPKSVLDAIHDRVSHGIFGYSEPSDDYFNALEHWFTHRLGYSFSPKWVTLTPGVVFAIAVAIRAFTKENEAVLIQEPVYYPFRDTIIENNRKHVVNELQLKGDEYVMDFADFEQKIAENSVKLFILCNPHNPVGRVWRRDELCEIMRICEKYDVLIISDEIHCDFIFPENTHLVLPALFPEKQDRIILCTAPSKTFNLAGLQLANIFISEPKLRRAFRDETSRSGFSQANSLGIVACRAAYESGADWLDALNKYLFANMNFIDEFLKKNIPTIRLIPPQATYLAWLDFRKLNISPEELERILVKKANLWLSRGDIFGAAGRGFIRINVACPRSTLDTCMNRILQHV